MSTGSRYSVPVAELDRVHVPLDEQVEEQDVRGDREHVAPEDLDRARLLSITGAGRLRPRQ